MTKLILSANDLIDHLSKLFDLSDKMKKTVKNPNLPIESVYYVNSLRGKLIGLWFEEPSTRTKCSFQAAIKKLGGNYVDLHDDNSTRKGESFSDTVKVLSTYFDALVIRSKGPFPDNFYCSVPVISAGDGIQEHPTQALLDIYTIRNHFSGVCDVCVVGDIWHSRTACSLAKLLGWFSKKKLYFYSCSDIPSDIRTLGEIIHNLKEFTDILPNLDVLYMTRVQKERSLIKYDSPLILNSGHLQLMKPNSIIMHPLPRQEELPEEVDVDPRAVYFSEQAPNGLYTRMALLKWLFSA